LTLTQVNQGLREYLKPAAVSVVVAGDFAKVAKEGESGAKATTSK
jgi:zinc protease